jgi:multiple antibiotic resistance protein
MDWHVYLNLFVALIVITNPIGAVAIFTSLTTDDTLSTTRQESVKAMFGIFCILTVVAWSGDLLLRAFGISQSAFEVGGALIIILLGLSMINAHNGKPHSEQNHSKEEQHAAKNSESIAIIPLSLPLVAGPGAITTLIIHTNKMGGAIVDKLATTGVCLSIALIFGLCFYFSNIIHKAVGDAAIKIATRIMGLVLVGIAFSMMQSGLVNMFPGWG